MIRYPRIYDKELEQRLSEAEKAKGAPLTPQERFAVATEVYASLLRPKDKNKT